MLSLPNLDQEVKEGDLLIEFDAQAERLALERSKATLAATEKELAVIRQQSANEREEAALTAGVDEVAVKEALWKREVARWARTRNKEGARVRWRFTPDRARTRLGRADPQVQAAVAAAA
ncbi:hypothetical protein [Myxococcus sp. CA056]|uniref:hypothetical protein n=1 Tax=Myxococcus sp. CA056 TaxID=2741740 RepID=UPI0020C6C42B|nr:hypothetical protein [Myxococcus sp. CA056]